MTNKIKILICAHSAQTSTGIGSTIRNIFRPLLEKYPDKYEIHQLGYFHINFNEFQIPWPIYPTRIISHPDGRHEIDANDKYGEISFHEVVDRIKPDIVFGYGDMWHFNHMLESPLRNSYRMLSYYTIDGQPYFGSIGPEGNTEWGTKLLKTDKLVVLSKFGKTCLKESCPEVADMDIEVRYHPIDVKKHKFLTIQEKKNFRKSILPPVIANNSFIIGWCGRNQFRKQNYKLWETLHYMVYGDYIECKDCNRITVKEYNHAKRATRVGNLTMYNHDYDYSHCYHCKSKNIINGIPQPDTFMWLHMPKTDNFYTCEFHERMWNVANKCIYTNGLDHVKGIPEDKVFDIFSSWDCMYYPSGGEGFGNPPYEAMACGVPIVYSNYSSHAEFCAHGGLPINVTYIPEPQIGIQRSIVDTNHAIEQLLKLYRSPELRYKLGESGRKYVSQFDPESMAISWDAIFNNMMSKPLPNKGMKMYSTVI